MEWVLAVAGRITETRENSSWPDRLLVQAVRPRCEAAGVLDQDPLLVYGEKTERTRLHESIDGGAGL